MVTAVLKMRNMSITVAICVCALFASAAERTVTWTDGVPRIDLAVFDRCVPPLLAQKADLLVLDELGKFEGGADEMRIAVENAFCSDTDLLAVVRCDAPDWMGALKQRSDACVLTVTAENRDNIPAALEKLLAK